MAEDAPGKRLIRRINRISNARPALGLRLAALVGFLGQPWLGEAWSPTREEFEELFGPQDERRMRRLQRRIAAGEVRNRAVIYVRQHAGPEKLASLFEVQGVDRLEALRRAGTPVAIVVWNLGVVRGDTLALHELGYTILDSVNRPPPRKEPGHRQLPVTTAPSRAQFLAQALKALRAGEIPSVGIGARAPQPRRHPFLGRSIPVPQGAGYLAARGNAALIPATTSWIGLSPRYRVVLHDPIPEPPRDGLSPEDWEFEMTSATVRWFEDYMRAHPEDLRPVNMRHVLKHVREHPRAPSQADFDALAESFDS